MDIPEKRLMHVRPEREELICSTCEALGYRLQEAKRADHMDTELLFQLEDPEAVSNSCRAKAESLLARLMQLDAQVTRYYLKLVCLVGMVGAACLGFSFAALKADLHILFTLLLIIGIFGCTITLYLRPLFTRMGMKKYGSEESAIIAELDSLLRIGGEDA